MDEDLKDIVNNMIKAGESEDNIALVIKSYKPAPIKKKESSDSNIASQITSVDSGTINGSLGGPKIKSERELATSTKENVLGPKPRRITTDINQIKKEDEAFKQNVNRKLSTYRQSTKVLPQEREQALAEVKDEVNQQGLANGIGTGLKQSWNKFVDVIGVGGDESVKQPWKASLDPIESEKKEAIQYFKENKIKATPQQIEDKAIELKTKNKITNLKQDKINDFLSNLDDQEKTYLEVDADKRFKTISKERKDISNRISLNEKTFEQIDNDLKNEMPEESRALLEQEKGKLAKYLEQDYKAFNKSAKELGTAEDELDAFKRNYGKLENISGRALASLGEAGLQTLQGIAYLRSLNPFDKEAKILEDDTQKSVQEAQAKIQESRNKLRPDIQEINTGNFVPYTLDLMANQTGTLATIATAGPVGGASILGLGQAGQTYSDMYQANKKGAGYSPAQMAIAPFVSGVSTGVLSELPTFQTLKNAGNVWKATLAEAGGKEMIDQAIKKTSSELVKHALKDTGKEIATESLDNVVQNMVKKDILGDESVGYFDNSWKTLKDTALLTGMLNAGVAPHVVISGTKMFMPNSDVTTLDSNAKKIMALSQQLDNINIDESAKTLVKEQIDALTKNSSKIVNTAMKRIDGLTDAQVKDIFDTNKRQEKLKNQAKEVKENPEIPIDVKETLLNGLEKKHKKNNEKLTEVLNAEIQKPIKSTEQNQSQPKAEVQENIQETPTVEKSEPVQESKEVEAKEVMPLEKLEQDYNEKTVDELVAIKKKLYPNPDIESSMTPEEKLLDKVIAKKFSDKNAEIKAKRNEKTPPSNTESNGNVRPTVEQVGEVGIEKKPKATVIEEKSVEPAVEPRASEKPNEVKKIKVYRGEPTKIDVPNKDITWVTPNKELADEYSYDLGIGKNGSLEKGVVTESEIEVPKNPLVLNYKGDTEVKGKDIGGGLRNALKEVYRNKKISIEKARSISEKISEYEKLAGDSLEPWHTKINKPSVTKLFVEIAKDLGYDGIQTNEGRKGEHVGYGLFKENKEPNEVRKVKSVKGATYDVHFDENENILKIISPKDGREIKQFTEYKTKDKTGKEITKLRKNPNYSQIEADALGTETNNKIKTEDKQSFNKALDDFTPSNEYEVALDALVRGAKVSRESIGKETGNNDNTKWATSKDGKSIERLAEELTKEGLDEKLIRDNLIDIINSHDTLSKVRETFMNSHSEKESANKEAEARAYLDGLSEKDFAMYESLKAEEEYLSELSDKEVEDYYNQKLNEYEQANTETTNEKPSDITKSDEGQKVEKQPTRQEKVIEKKKVSDAKIDDFFDALKDILPKGFDTDSLKKNGLSQDDLIDLVAKGAKALANTGIEINEAIRQVIDKLKEHFENFNVEVKDVLDKHFAEAENTFEKKSGKKSLLSRIAEGNNADKITKAVSEYGLDYEVENQEQAQKRANEFVEKEGVEIALEAVRNNHVKGAEKAFVYQKVLDELQNEIENAPEDQKQALEELNSKIIGEITNEFDLQSRDAGRFISALNKVYNSSQLRYNLSKQINDYKANSKDGTIPESVLEKFKEADAKIKDLEKKIKEAEERQKLAEEKLAIENIQEDIARKNKPAKETRKPILSEKEQTRKKELRNKFFGTLNDVTRIATMLADPEFREYLKLTMKEAKGEFSEFAKEILKTLGKGSRKYLTELYTSAGGKGEIDPKYINTIKVSEDGKISIPEQLIRDYVEEGYTEIEDLAKALLDTIKNDYPDITIRQMRDAITNYGKTINPNKEEIATQIRQMKRIGKLISGLEDANEGTRPARSGLQRDEITQRERKMKRDLRDLLRDLPMDEADISKRWKTALDSVKSRLKNSIEDLEKQIENKEKSKPQRNPIEYDAEAKELKSRRDALRKALDEIVGKPELTEEQKIDRTEKYLVKSIDALKEKIDSGNIEFKQKPNSVTSAKIEALKKAQTELRSQLANLRKEAGLVEAKRLETAKRSIKTRIGELNRRIAEGDFSKKENKPLIPDTELAQLQAEKIRVQEVYDSEKYKQELANRKTWQKTLDGVLEVWNIPRILKATGELSSVFVQGGVLTVSRKLTNPKELYKSMFRLFTSIGSDTKAREYESLIKASPIYPIAEKAKLALTNPDFKSSVREEQYTGDYVNMFWDLPIMVAELRGKDTFDIKTQPIGNKIANQLRDIFGKEKKEFEKISRKEQWKNTNPFVALERGGTLFMNQLRFEEFARGCEKLELQGKNPIDNLEEYKLLANAINTMTGRANIGTLATNSKTLSALFFSFRNWVSVVNQMNPIYYGYLHFKGENINASNWYKETSVANKLATHNMMRFIGITGMFMFAMKALAGKDDDGNDIVEIETDPRSSDFMKMKIGNIRFDPWHGQSTQVVFITRMLTDEKKSTSTKQVEKLGEGYGDIKSRGDLAVQYVTNKLAPSSAILWKYMNTHEGYDKLTGEKVRLTPYGEVYDGTDESLNLMPMYWASVQEIQKEDPNAWVEFLTVASFFGMNSTVYNQKPKPSYGPQMPQMPKMPELPKIK